MRSLAAEELVKSRFVPTVVYVREGPDFHTRICAYNYFSELFPDVRSGVTGFLWCFDQTGQLVDDRSFDLPYRGQLQFDLQELGMEFEGTAGFSMVPDEVPSFDHEGVGTGYYVLYNDDAGHADFSHEWDAMRFRMTESVPWICVVRPGVTQNLELIVMNSYYGNDPEIGTSHWTLTLRDSQGNSLAERDMPDLPPRGSTRLNLRDEFPELDSFGSAGTVAVEAKGQNIMGPFTLVRQNGDFNVHHFC